MNCGGLLDSGPVPRFLERSSISNRLIGVLILSVGIPGLVLGAYALRSVLQEEAIYRSERRGRAEGLAEHVRDGLEKRYYQLIEEISSQTEAQGDSWITEPDAAAARLQDSDSTVLGTLVFDSSGVLTSPLALTTWPQPDLSSLPIVNLRWSGGAVKRRFRSSWIR